MATAPSRANSACADLDAFRTDFYRCLTARADALFELVDGLCSPVRVDSLAHLTLAASVRRGHGAAYAALANGRIDAEQFRDVLPQYRPTDWSPDFAVDTTTWPRIYATCSPGRSHYYHPSRHLGGQPTVAGWCYQWLLGLSPRIDSWTAPLDAQRLDPGDNPNTVAIRQIEQLLPRLGPLMVEPLFVFDAGYDILHLTRGLCGENAQIAIRVRADRIFYTRPARTSLDHDLPRNGTRGGRPPLHGIKMRCLDPGSWPEPDYHWQHQHPKYGLLKAQAWYRLPPSNTAITTATGYASIIEGTAIRIEVEHLPGRTANFAKTLWLWWVGPRGAVPHPERIVRAYLRRFDAEHTFRFVKQVLGWTAPRLR